VKIFTTIIRKKAVTEDVEQAIEEFLT